MERNVTQSTDVGWASIAPTDPVIAGSVGCWKILYRVGDCALNVGAGIRLNTDSDTDWGEIQFDDPKGLNYTTIRTTGKSKLSWVLRGGFVTQELVISINYQPLMPGDEIQITIGDRSHGGSGSRVQTFAEQKRYFRISVDLQGNGHYVELPTNPHLRVVGGPIDRLSIIAPSQVLIGEAFRLVVRALDKYGNPSHNYRSKIIPIQEENVCTLADSYSFTPADHGVLCITDVVADRSGIFRITLKDDKGRTATSNPIVCLENPQEYKLYWGDLHGQVRVAEKIEEYFKFARDVSAVDFAGHQRNDHEMSNEHWQETQRAVKKINAPHSFVAFLGFEWSGQYEVGGDHNIYFLDDDQPIRRSGHDMVEEKSDAGNDLTHITDIYDAYSADRMLIIPHVGGRPANLTYHDPKFEPVIEIHSTHGTFEWFLRDALKRGWKVGFVAGSDGYKLRQGGSYPGIADRRFVRGGLVAVYAKELTRESLFEAIKARRCYGTTGHRIVLEVRIDGHVMGDEYTTTGLPTVHVLAVGTESIEKIEVYRGLKKIYDHPLQDAARSAKRIKITWEGASREWPYSGVMWQGELRAKDGTARLLSTLPLDRGDEFISEDSDNGFKWLTFTSGDLDGATLEVEDEEAEITVLCTSTPTVSALGRVCSPMTQVEKIYYSFSAKELVWKPIQIDVGPVGRRILIRGVAEGRAPRDVEFEFTDGEIEEGLNPYWIKVTQSDGEMAWSSPVYVNRVNTSAQ
jgi:hypothetical protein